MCASTNYAPDVTISLTAEDVQHTQSAVAQAVETFGPGDSSTLASYTAGRLVEGENTINVIAASLLTKALSLVDGGPMAVLFGVPEEDQSPAFQKIDSLLNIEADRVVDEARASGISDEQISEEARSQSSAVLERLVGEASLQAVGA